MVATIILWFGKILWAFIFNVMLPNKQNNKEMTEFNSNEWSHQCTLAIQCNYVSQELLNQTLIYNEDSYRHVSKYILYSYDS